MIICQLLKVFMLFILKICLSFNNPHPTFEPNKSGNPPPYLNFQKNYTFFHGGLPNSVLLNQLNCQPIKTKLFLTHLLNSYFFVNLYGFMTVSI